MEREFYDPTDFPVYVKACFINNLNMEPELANELVKSKDRAKLVKFAKFVLDEIWRGGNAGWIPVFDRMKYLEFRKQLKFEYFSDALNEWSASQT